MERLDLLVDGVAGVVIVKSQQGDIRVGVEFPVNEKELVAVYLPLGTASGLSQSLVEAVQKAKEVEVDGDKC